MTKAKTEKSAAGARKSDAKESKPAKDAEKKAPAAKSVKKTVEKAGAKSKPVQAGAKAVKPAKAKAAPKDASAAPAKPPVPAPAAKPAAVFVNAGLGVKASGKKPALSVAPGVMTLGRPAQAKASEPACSSERRLSKKEQLDIKIFLSEKRERLLAAMRRELAMQRERAASKAADEVDKATDAYDEDLSFEIATANDQELQEIQIALEKIEKGTYGECEICGCGISPSRLKILPSATTCVSCRGQEELARRRDDGQQLFNMMEDGGEAEAEPM